MAVMLRQQLTLVSQQFCSIPRTMNTKLLIPAASLSNSRFNSRFLACNCKLRSTNVAKYAGKRSGFTTDDKEIFKEQVNELPDYRTPAQIKADLYQAVKGVDRGIFGISSTKKSEIEGLIELMESQNPTPDPASNLMKVDGCWKLVYTTLTILGKKRTKLGLRHFTSLGEIYQIIDVSKGKAFHMVQFSIRGMNRFNGQLTVEASFKITSKSRVKIDYDKSTITPEQLMNVLSKNHDLLLSIFSPEGWLEITYVDDNMMIGRDNKGNQFVVDKLEQDSTTSDTCFLKIPRNS